jgi:hypothetical protein
MLTRRRSVVAAARALALLVALLALWAWAADAKKVQKPPEKRKVPETAIPFELKDQYRETHLYAFPCEEVRLLLIGDRHTGSEALLWFNALVARYRGPEFLEDGDGVKVLEKAQGRRHKEEETDELAGIEAVAEAYRERVAIDGIAATKDIPAIWRPLVRWFFRQHTETPVMLDWDDAVSFSYGFVRKQVNIYVIAPDASVKLRVHGKATRARVDKVFEAVETELGIAKTAAESPPQPGSPAE